MKNNILIVDDSESIREIISFGLTAHGYNVITGNNGEHGLKLLNLNPEVVLVITDLNMPIIDGITFIKKIRKTDKYKYLPIIILTTESCEQKKIEAQKAGATGWIIKPFSIEKLVSIVKKNIK